MFQKVGNLSELLRYLQLAEYFSLLAVKQITEDTTGSISECMDRYAVSSTNQSRIAQSSCRWAASNLSISLFVIGRFRVASRNRRIETESPGEEIDTEALHRGADIPHAKIVLQGRRH